jgi:hypothetical protein
MKRIIAIALFTVIACTQADAQKIFATRNGKITFTSPSDGDVSAVNNEVTSRISDNGQLTFSLLLKGFKFKLAEMQEHFNDQYVESTKFPRADFKGNIVNVKDVNFGKDGTYKVTVKGDLTMHGVTKNITVTGSINIKGGKPSANASFVIKMADFKIDASSVTATVNAEVSCQYQ